MTGLPPLTAHDMATGVRAGRLDPGDLVETALDRAEAIAPLNAFTAIDREGALAAARHVEERLAAGEGGTMPLAGVPVAIKDFTPTAGLACTRGSWSTGDRLADRDPAVIARLKRAGAILVGRTTTPEFAYSSFTQSPRWGVTRNPHDPARTPGGSSGGSAVAVATGCVPLAEGSDMGGSVRIPAALSGVVGVKPSLGLIPMDILPCGPDLMSHFGPLAACVDDAALFLAATAGPDAADYFSQSRPDVPTSPVPPAPPGTRIALSIDLGYYAVDPGVARQVEQAAERLRGHGMTVEPVPLRWTRDINDAWLMQWAVALAANWGTALDTHRDRMDPALVALMETGRDCDAVALVRLGAVRERLWRDLAEVFEHYDALICPTCATTAPPVSMSDADFEVTAPDGRFAGLDLACPFNLVSACPAVSVPIGRSEGLPVGLQIVAPRFRDAVALGIAKSVEACFPPEAVVETIRERDLT